MSVKPIVSTQTVSNVVSSVTGGGTTTTNVTVTRSLSGTPEERAAEMNRQLSAAMAQTTPGGNVMFVSAGDSAVSMRRTYERPVAIGYRGFLLKVSRDHSVEGVGAIGGDGGGWVPTAKPKK